MSNATFTENALFRGLQDKNARFNATVGNNGGPYDLYDYAYGYFEATRLLLAEAQKPGAIIDILVYPVCLNFRHAVELYIKYLITDLAKVMKSKEAFEAKHVLKDNWNVAQNLLKASDLKAEDEEIKLLSSVVDSITEVDPNGVIFRYPESIKGEQHLKDWSLINLVVLEDCRRELFEVAHTWHHRIEARLGR